MNYFLKTTAVFALIVSLAACGGNAKKGDADTAKMKEKLEKLKKQKNDLDADIRKLEDDIAKADPDAAAQVRKLVGVDTLKSQDFSHYIELQGKINADGIAYVSPTGQGGLVKAIYVKAGDRVAKGKLLVKLDDALARQGVVAAEQQTGQLKARLTQAQTVYERYQNLWKQNIGAEINVINAKADVDALQSQLKAAEANVAMAKEQLNMTNVYAGMSGVVEQVNVRVGEFFTGATPGGQAQILLVNSSSLKVEVPVPDTYVARVKKGDKVLVEVPETGKPAFPSVISVVGAAINPTTRSFTAEARLPADPLLKPNQTALMKILDYQSKDAVVVPVNVVQSDDKGKYVYIMVKEGDKYIARKKNVEAGETYGSSTEIKSGLSHGDLIITEGYQNVYDGQAITTGQ